MIDLRNEARYHELIFKLKKYSITACLCRLHLFNMSLCTKNINDFSITHKVLNMVTIKIMAMIIVTVMMIKNLEIY